MKISIFAGLLLLATLLIPGPAPAGRFGGGGGRVGGGGGVAHAPVSHPAPVNRPAPVQHSTISSASSVHGPYGGNFSGVQNNSHYTGAYGGAGASVSGAGKYTGPHGATVIGGGKGGTYTGPKGNTVSGGEAGHVVIGPNGNIHAGGSKGAAVTTPGGAGIATGKHGAVTTLPGGGAVGKASTGSVAFGPHGVVGGKNTIVAGHGAGGAAFVGTRHVDAAAFRNQGVYVRNNFNHYGAFRPGWYNRYPGAWFAAGWAAGAAWRYATFPTYAGLIGYPVNTTPIYYDYGNTVVYQDGNVYHGDVVYATEAQYADQASALAVAGQQAPPADDTWQALGVFAMVQGDEQTSNDIFQLALGNGGVVRGNYYNAVADSTTPVIGSVDKKTQRIAWTIGDKKFPVYETGLYNLTQEQTTMLVHFAPDRTVQYKLFRLPPQDDNKSGK